MNRSQWLRGVLATVLMATGVAGVWGQQAVGPANAQKMSLDIPSQPIAGALTALGQQSGLTIMLAAVAKSDAISPAVVGDYTPDEALRKILASSGLNAEYLDRRTVAIRTAQPKHNTSSGQQKNDNEPHKTEEKQKAPTGPNQKAAPPTTSEGPPDSSQDTASKSPRAAVPEILVTASRSLNADIERTPDDIQPYVVISKELIQSSGATNIEELLKDRLTMNYVPVSGSQQGVMGVGNQSVIALRGLDATQTLILVDGRRPALQGGADGTTYQPDLNGIPLNAIERIEVLPATASGIYGGSATGGVVNIVLRHDYTGVDAIVTYDNSIDGGGETRRVELNGGFNWDDGRTSALLNASYSDGTPLLARQRSFTSSYAAKYAANAALNPTPGSQPSGYTSNIGTQPQYDPVSGTFVTPDLTLKSNGQSLNSPITFVPPGYQGPSTDGGAALGQNAGHYNLMPPNTDQQPNGALAALVSPSTIKSVSTTIRRQLSEHFESFLQLTWSENYSRFDTNFLPTEFQIPGSAPSNPFMEDLNATTPVFSNAGVVSDSKAARALVGLIGDLGQGWKAEADFAFDRTDFRQSSPPVTFLDTLAPALASGAVNLFADTNSFRSDLFSYAAPPTQINPLHSVQKDATLRVAGPVWTLPAGDMTVSVLAEHRQELYSDSTQVQFNSDGSTTVGTYSQQESSVNSVYAETLIPLVSNRNHLSVLQTFELEVAGRFDHYVLDPGTGSYGSPQTTVIGAEVRNSAWSPTVGIRLGPTPDVTFRASYGKGFDPPQLSYLNPTKSSFSYPGFFFTDPRRGGEPLDFITYQTGGNPDLHPEHSESRSAGVVITPRFIPRLRASVDWIKILKTDDITQLTLTQNLIDADASLPGIFTRAPAAPGDPFPVGPIVGFDGRYTNIARAESESYDLAISYELPTARYGVWNWGAAATRLVHNSQQAASIISPIEYAGTFGYPTWSANTTLSWTFRNWNLAWTARYLDSYWVFPTHIVDPAQGSSTVASAVYHDFSIHFRTQGRSGSNGLLSSGWDVRGGIKNVFNREPRFYAYFGSFYDPWTDPRMATYFLSLGKEF